MVSVYLAPVTELTSSEDEGTTQAKPPPGKKPRHAGVSHGVSPEFSAAALLDEPSQCSKERSSGRSCYLKLQDSLSDLTNVREQFRSLHKIDQDQVDF